MFKAILKETEQIHIKKNLIKSLKLILKIELLLC